MTTQAQVSAFLTTEGVALIRKVVARRLPWQDVDDVSSQVLLQMTQRLQQDGLGELTADERARYLAMAAHHACDHHLRRTYPLRWRLRNRIRYLLEHDPAFALWKDADDAWICGLAAMRGGSPAGATPAGVTSVPPNDIRRLLMVLFEETGAPFELGAVVSIAAASWGIPRTAQDASAVDLMPDPSPGAEQQLVDREAAQQVWREIRELPVRQRTALLLNLRDDALSLFVATGTASLRAIAAALDFPAIQLAELWPRLPLADNDIAAMLNCTRQQVINLRNAARKRLANRLPDRANMGRPSRLLGGER